MTIFQLIRTCLQWEAKGIRLPHGYPAEALKVLPEHRGEKATKK